MKMHPYTTGGWARREKTIKDALRSRTPSFSLLSCAAQSPVVGVSSKDEAIYSFGSQTILTIEGITCKAVEYRVLSHV